jgi:hypothetical protein
MWLLVVGRADGRWLGMESRFCARGRARTGARPSPAAEVRARGDHVACCGRRDGAAVCCGAYGWVMAGDEITFLRPGTGADRSAAVFGR